MSLPAPTIKPEDFYKFSNCTATALKFFKVKPIVKGVPNFKFDEIPKNKIETDTWLLSKSTGFYSASIVAVQGNVQYRVDPNKILNSLSPAHKAFLMKTNIILFFAIGDLEVAANREEIRYDGRSLKAITCSIKDVYENLTPEIEERLGKITGGFWDVCVDLNRLSRELFNDRSFIRNHANAEHIKSDILRRYITEQGAVNVNVMYGYDVYHYTLKHRFSDAITKRKYLSGNYLPCADTAIIINDIKYGGIKRLGQFLDNSNILREAILITKRKIPHKHVGIESKIIPYIGYDKELEQFTDDIGNPWVRKLSEITDAPVKQEASRSLTFYTYEGLRHRHNTSRSDIYHCFWDKCEHDIEDGGIYIPLKFGTTPALLNNNGLTVINFTNPKSTDVILKLLINEYNEENGTNHSHCAIWGLPSSTCKKAAKIDNWINLFDFAKTIIPKYEDMITYYHRRNATSVFAGIKDACGCNGFDEIVRLLAKSSTFRKAVLPLIDARLKYEIYDNNKLRTVDTLQAIADIEKIFGDVIRKDIKPFFDETTLNKYSMLKLIPDIDSSTDWHILLDYIKTIDRKK